ncbi:hypothetical protein [Labrenzia sp. PHM005]|uniref:hypothetical protein n=1 Tax=Stappiaceae TaxID=2821832 RepID=UPI001AD93291|nr:hypothetical protein [Labrenzia sp. PHM005]
MNAFSQNNDIIADWQDKHSMLFDRHNVKLKHRLAETGLFSEEALGKLIDKLPLQHYTLNTMGHDKNVKEWRHGEIGNLSGQEVIDCIRNGRLWINVFRIMDIDPQYEKVLNQIFSEFESRVPGLKTFMRNMTLLVSSPKIQVYYHADIQGQSLWQLHGKKRVYVYPISEAFLTEESIEKILMQETEEEVPFKPWFDDYAEVHDLEAGEMMHWPLYGPHRVENHDCLNISVTTEHWTRDIRHEFAVRYGNGVLRRTLGLKGLSTEPKGWQVYPKAAAALAWKRLKLEKKRKVQRMIDFRLDPSTELGYVDIEPYAK